MRYDCYYEFHSTFPHITVDFFSFAGNFFSLYSTAKSCANCAEFLNFSMFFCATRIGGDFFLLLFKLDFLCGTLHSILVWIIADVQ